MENSNIASPDLKSMIETYRPIGKSGDCLITIAIGEPYRTEWEKHALSGWRQYCERYDLGLYAVSGDLIAQNHPKWKKATWQKLLLGKALLSIDGEVQNACYLDTDILINPTAPNIFDFYDGQSYGLVSQIKNLPMPLDLVMRQYVFLRHHFYDQKYPLDSVVFMPVEKQYEYSGLTPLDDSACAGLILFRPEKHAAEMERWFFKYDRQTPSVTDGDQTHLNWEMINTSRVQWLPYEFQALWVYEMAWKYPFLYRNHQENTDLIRSCIEASLFSNHFLHFAGSWHESDMWLVGNILCDEQLFKMHLDFRAYQEHPLSGEPRGPIKPVKPEPSRD